MNKVAQTWAATSLSVLIGISPSAWAQSPSAERAQKPPQRGKRATPKLTALPKRPASPPKTLKTPENAAADSVHPVVPGLAYRKRHFPLWVELTGMGIGVAGMVSALIMHQLNGKILYKSKQQYPYEFDVLAPATLIASSQIFVISSIFFAIDQWPRKRKSRSLADTLRLRH